MASGILPQMTPMDEDVSEGGLFSEDMGQEEKPSPQVSAAATTISGSRKRAKELRGINENKPQETEGLFTVATSPSSTDSSYLFEDLNLDANAPSDLFTPTDLAGVTLEDASPALPTERDPSPGKFDEADVLNFLVGPELAIMGITYDNAGWHANVETAKQQWSEAPVWSNVLNTVSLLGGMAFPAGMAVKNTLKFGRAAEALGFLPEVAEELNNWKKLGLVDPEVSALDYGKRYKLRKMVTSMGRYQDRQNRLIKAARGEAPANAMDQMIDKFDNMFRNSYFEGMGDPVSKVNYARQLRERLDANFETHKIGALLESAPEEEHGYAIYSYLMNKSTPGIISDAPKLSPAHQKWADMLWDKGHAHQLEALEEGFISPEEMKHVGPVHIPAQTLGTPDPGIDKFKTFILKTGAKPKETVKGFNVTSEPREGILGSMGFTRTKVDPIPGERYVGIKLSPFPRLTNETLLQRKADLPEVARKLQIGELITDPAQLTTRGYLTDRLLLDNFKLVRDIVMNPQWGYKHADIITKFPKKAQWEKAGFSSLEALPDQVKSRLRRMLTKKGHALGENEPLPFVRREIFDEIFGETGMLSQTENTVSILELLTSIHKTSKTVLNPRTHATNLIGNFAMMSQAGMNPFSPENLDLMKQANRAFKGFAELHVAAKKAGIKSANLFDSKLGLVHSTEWSKIKIGDKTFDLVDEMKDKAVQDLIEESAFETAEGFNHIENLLAGMGKDQVIGRAIGKAFLGAKKAAQIGDRAKWIDGMTKAYLAEDMVPKMAMYLSLRGQGLSKTAAVYETGRRLPMYATTGKAITKARKYAIPWATFPTEALRITKNNMFDHPLRLMPWLRAPQIMQSFLSGFTEDTPQSLAEVQEARGGLPEYAQTPGTVLASGGAVAGAGGGLTGALAGGLAGSKVGGAYGALAGGIAGGIAGAMGASRWADNDKENSEAVRGALLDWLPNTAFLPQMTPNIPHFNTFQDVFNTIPGAPLGILQPLINVATGKTMFGTEIKAEGLGDKMVRSFSGLLGFMSPPLMQKYLFREGTPDVSLLEATLGKELETDPTRFTNVQKALWDTGSTIDPVTLKPGSLTHDAFLNNASIRSYLSTPAQQLSNESVTEESLRSIRSYLSRNMRYYAMNEMDTQMIQILTKVQATFAQQYASNPQMAQEKFMDWVKNQKSDIKRHPKLRGWSEEELVQRFNDANKFAVEARVESRNQMTDFLRTELMSRRAVENKTLLERWEKKQKSMKTDVTGGIIK